MVNANETWLSPFLRLSIWTHTAGLISVFCCRLPTNQHVAGASSDVSVQSQLSLLGLLILPTGTSGGQEQVKTRNRPRSITQTARYAARICDLSGLHTLKLS